MQLPNMRSILFVLFAAIILNNTANAQYGLYHIERAIPTDPLDKLTYLSVASQISSDNVWMGRKHSKAIPYLTTYLKYNLYFGLELSAATSYTHTDSNGRFDRNQIGIAWNRNLGKYNYWYVSVGYNQYFNYEKSKTINAGISSMLYMQVWYKKTIIEPRLSYIYTSGDASDGAWIGEICHTFRFKNQQIEVIPNIGASISSANFYNNYLYRQYEHTPWASNYLQKRIEDPEANRLMCMSISCPVNYYTRNGWLLSLKPSYIVPSSSINIIEGSKKSHETANTSIVLQLDACYRIERK